MTVTIARREVLNAGITGPEARLLLDRHNINSRGIEIDKVQEIINSWSDQNVIFQSVYQFKVCLEDTLENWNLQKVFYIDKKSARPIPAFTFEGSLTLYSGREIDDGIKIIKWGKAKSIRSILYRRANARYQPPNVAYMNGAPFKGHFADLAFTYTYQRQKKRNGISCLIKIYLKQEGSREIIEALRNSTQARSGRGHVGEYNYTRNHYKFKSENNCTSFYMSDNNQNWESLSPLINTIEGEHSPILDRQL